MFFKKKRMTKDRRDTSTSPLYQTKQNVERRSWEEMDDIEILSQNRIEANRALSKEMEDLRDLLKISSQ